MVVVNRAVGAVDDRVARAMEDGTLINPYPAVVRQYNVRIKTDEQ